MSVRASLLVSLLLSGCLQTHAAHTRAVASTPPCPAQASTPTAPAPIATAAGSGAFGPREVLWKLRVHEGAPGMDLPATLHAFSLGRWECAVSEVRSDGQVATRRLACTHATGVTVESQLGCARDAHKPADELTRELELSLDGATPLQLRCEARAADT